jgi:choline dehydrogenase-like flavoprotein
MRIDRFDALVVGSGASGGWAARQLTESGLSVGVIEAATRDVVANRVRSAIQSQCYAYTRDTAPYFIDDEKNPYTHPDGSPFVWIRGGAVGGKTLLWAGNCYRLSDSDFKAASADGIGQDWPISHSDVSPFYGTVERFLGVAGNRDGLPQVPDGEYLPVEDLGPEQQRLADSAAELGAHLIRARLAIRPLAEDELCMHCGDAGRGCRAYISSVHSTLAAASRTGRLTLFAGLRATRVLADRSGPYGVQALKISSGERLRLEAPLVFLCASTLESTRLLLNSRLPALEPCKTLGRCLMDHICGSMQALYKPLSPTWREEFAQPKFLYIPRWQNLDVPWNGKFHRGYALQLIVGSAEDLIARKSPLCARKSSTASLPVALKNMVLLQITGMGEMLPNPNNFVELDPSGCTDAWGVPVLKVHCRHRENDLAIFDEMRRSAKALVKTVGGFVYRPMSILAPGLAIHEGGTCRMGADPDFAVLDAFNSCHYVPNLYVTDGSAMPSIGTQNPALTLMALTARACSHAVRVDTSIAGGACGSR